MGIDLGGGRLPERPDDKYRPLNSGGSPDDSGDPLSWFRDHPHRVALAIVGLLLICAFIGLVRDNNRIFWLLLFLAIVVALIWNTPAVLRRRQVIERWDMLIPGGNGHAETVMVATRTHIRALDPPGIVLESANLAPGVLRGLSGDTRPFVVVRNRANGRIHSYWVFVNVRDYGKTLQTSWYLAYLPTFWQRFRGRLGLDLDLFDEQDLRAYVSVVHHGLVEAVTDLLTGLGRETDFDRTSKGFLGIS